MKTMNNETFINYLKTLPENSRQLVDLKHSDGVLRCYFMWFYTDVKIDLRPIDNINILTIHERDFDKIYPVIGSLPPKNDEAKICYCGNPIDYLNPDCVHFSLCKDHAMDC
jgi:hypothetical protein